MWGLSCVSHLQETSQDTKAFNALAKEGQIQMPIGKTFFSPRFGVVADKFGVSWMVIVPGEM